MIGPIGWVALALLALGVVIHAARFWRERRGASANAPGEAARPTDLPGLVWFGGDRPLSAWRRSLDGGDGWHTLPEAFREAGQL